MDLEEFEQSAPAITEKKAREALQDVLLAALRAKAAGAPLRDDQLRAKLVDRGLWLPPRSKRDPGELPHFKDKEREGKLRMLTPRFH